jgi:hypothetical protein
MAQLIVKDHWHSENLNDFSYWPFYSLVAAVRFKIPQGSPVHFSAMEKLHKMQPAWMEGFWDKLSE